MAHGGRRYGVVFGVLALTIAGLYGLCFRKPSAGSRTGPLAPRPTMEQGAEFAKTTKIFYRNYDSQEAALQEVERLSALLAQRPDAWTLFSERGDAYAYLGQSGKAIKDYDRALSLWPPDARVHDTGESRASGAANKGAG